MGHSDVWLALKQVQFQVNQLGQACPMQPGILSLLLVDIFYLVSGCILKNLPIPEGHNSLKLQC